MFGMVFTSVASRISAEFLANIHNPYFQRYFYVSKLLFAVLLLSQLLPRLRHGIANVSLSAKCAILLLIALCLFHTNRVNQLLYQSSVTEGQRVKAFLASVQTNLQKARAGLPYTSEWVLRREGKWSFALNIDRHLGREHNNNSLARTGS
jgi:hypothetical protein